MERDPLFTIDLPVDLDLSLPDNIVALTETFVAKLAALLERGLALDEVPSPEAIVAAFCEHFDLDPDFLKVLIFAGQVVELDRNFRDMTPFERDEWIERRNREIEDMNERIERIAEAAAAEQVDRVAEVDMLEALWEQSPDD